MAIIVGTRGDDSFENSLFGTLEDDLLVGLQGTDFLHGSLGNDILVGGTGFDVALYTTSEFDAGITVNNTEFDQGGVAAFTVETAVGTDTLDGIEAFNLSEGDDIAYVTAFDINAGGSYTFDGGGDDTVIVAVTENSATFTFFAGAGNDSFTGGDGFAYIEYGVTDPTGTAGITLAFTSADTGTIIDPYGDTDIFASVGGVGGTQLEDVMIGSDGFQILNGAGGADVLDGGADADFLTGGAGADTFVVGLNVGDDIIFDFENGVDRLDVTAFGLTPAQALAGAPVAVSVDGDGDTLIDFSVFGGTGEIELVGLAISDLSPDDFVL